MPMRDVIIHYILFLASPRNGALIELLLNELESGKWVESEEGKKFWQVEVFRHKTLLTHGAFHINIEPEVYRYVQIFIKKVRPKCLVPRGSDRSIEQHIMLPWSNKTQDCTKVQLAFPQRKSQT